MFNMSELSELKDMKVSCQHRQNMFSSPMCLVSIFKSETIDQERQQVFNFLSVIRLRVTSRDE